MRVAYPHPHPNLPPEGEGGTSCSLTGKNFPSPSWGGAPKRGAGIGATWSRDPLAGCDREADQGRVVPMPIPCASPGSDHHGGSSLMRARSYCLGLPNLGPSSDSLTGPVSRLRPSRRPLQHLDAAISACPLSTHSGHSLKADVRRRHWLEFPFHLLVNRDAGY